MNIYIAVVLHLNNLPISKTDIFVFFKYSAYFSIQSRMDTYQTQLRALAVMIDNLLPIEIQIEQKINTFEFYNNYQVIYNTCL